MQSLAELPVINAGERVLTGWLSAFSSTLSTADQDFGLTGRRMIPLSGTVSAQV
jgi:hypothetical protein